MSYIDELTKVCVITNIDIAQFGFLKNFWQQKMTNELIKNFLHVSFTPCFES